MNYNSGFPGFTKYEEWNGLLSGFVKSRWYVNILVCLTIFL